MLGTPSKTKQEYRNFSLDEFLANEVQRRYELNGVRTDGERCLERGLGGQNRDGENLDVTTTNMTVMSQKVMSQKNQKNQIPSVSATASTSTVGLRHRNESTEV